MTDHNDSSPARAARLPFYYGYIIVVSAFFISVVAHGMRNSYGVFFKPMATEFGWTRAVTSGAFSLAWMMEGVLSILIGALNDRFGPRVVLTCCGALLGLAYILMSRIENAWQLYLFYGVMAGAGGSIFIPVASTVARWFITRRSLMTGLALAGIGVGSLIGPPATNALIAAMDWRNSYIVIGIVALIFVVVCAQFMKRDPSKMGMVPYGESTPVKGVHKFAAKSLTLKEAIPTRQFWLVFGMLFCFGFCYFAVAVHIVPYATDLQIPAASAAGILAVIGGSSIVARVASGSVGDRIGNKNAFAIGFALMALALFGLVRARETWQLYTFGVLLGIANGDCGTQESPLVASLFGLASHGLIFGTVGISFTIGAALGPFVSGYVFDVTGSYEIAFLTAAGVAIAGIIMTLLLPVANIQKPVVSRQ